jgi:hypothetical protein
MKGRSLRIWGAERIAEVLIDKITFNDAAVEALSAYLPVLTEFLGRGRARPPVPRARPEAPAAPCGIRRDPSPPHQRDVRHPGRHRRQWKIGRGGGLRHRSSPGLQPLDLARRRRGSPCGRPASGLADAGAEKRNIASLMRTRRCLVVIDDPQPSSRPRHWLCFAGRGPMSWSRPGNCAATPMRCPRCRRRKEGLSSTAAWRTLVHRTSSIRSGASPLSLPGLSAEIVEAQRMASSGRGNERSRHCKFIQRAAIGYRCAEPLQA